MGECRVRHQESALGKFFKTRNSFGLGMTTDIYCMSCVPLRPGVWAIALLQAMYSGVQVYLAHNVEDQLRDFSFYFDYTAHCLGLAAALFLILGILLERPQLLLPWVGLTILVPANFLASLGLNLLFFNLMGALWLVGTEGIPIIITAYLIQVVYTLYCVMVDSRREGNVDSEQATASAALDTLYGTSNVVFVSENSNSVVGSVTPSLQDAPPAYESLVASTKQHLAS